MSMLENLKKVEAEKNLGGGDYFKVQNGNNIIRVCTEGVYHESEFKGKDGKVTTTKKFVMFIIDRKDGKVKPYFAPYTIYKAIASLEQDPFYKFEGMPMPYDINVKVENAGTLNAEYSIQADPNKKSLTADETKALAEKGSILDYVVSLNENKDEAKLTPAEIVAKASGGKFVPDDVNVDDIPFGNEPPDFLK